MCPCHCQNQISNSTLTNTIPQTPLSFFLLRFSDRSITHFSSDFFFNNDSVSVKFFITRLQVSCFFLTNFTATPKPKSNKASLVSSCSLFLEKSLTHFIILYWFLVLDHPFSIMFMIFISHLRNRSLKLHAFSFYRFSFCGVGGERENVIYT